MSLILNRSTDLDNQTLWVAAELDEEKSRSRQLYLGLDVNGAIKAAVDAGYDRAEVVARAEGVLERIRNEAKLNDAIAAAPAN